VPPSLTFHLYLLVSISTLSHILRILHIALENYRQGCHGVGLHGLLKIMIITKLQDNELSFLRCHHQPNSQ